MTTGANDPAERSFSLVKKLWTNDRSELTLTRIRSLALIKFNCNQTCMEFFNGIKETTDILRAIQSGGKYIQTKSRIKSRALILNDDQIINSIDDKC